MKSVLPYNIILNLSLLFGCSDSPLDPDYIESITGTYLLSGKEIDYILTGEKIDDEVLR